MWRALAAGVVMVGFAAGAAADQDVLALIERAKAAAQRNDQAGLVQALQDALREARGAAPLAADPFVLVAAKASSYGAYTPRKDAIFEGDEAMLFYLEPKNLVYPRNEKGFYTPGLSIDLEIRDAAGLVVGRKERFGVFPFTSQSPLQDIYVNLETSLTGAPPGNYEVRFVLHDLNSPKTVTLTQKVTRR
jgi:hypothetical protein